jgi:two-component system, cell cycle sensor histidine kinase and response regulator CckA
MIVPPSVPAQIFGGDDGGDQASKRLAAAGLAAATVFSALILWLVTQNLVLVGGLLAGMVAFWAVADFLRRNRSPDAIAAALPPDWSVTRAVADQDEAAVAITDRAGRLLCANDHFTKSFEGLRAPPDLGLDEASH